MHVISKRPFMLAAKAHPNQKRALGDIYKVLCKCDFKTSDEMRQVFPSLDNFTYKDKWWVIDIGGNHLRAIVFIQFVNKRVYVKYILTHSEYDKLCKRYAKGELL